MKKPTPKPRKAVLRWSEVADYVEAKHKRSLRDWAGKFAKRKTIAQSNKTPYHDFWHHLCDAHEINNGDTVTLCPKEILSSDDVLEFWLMEIYTILQKEFGDEFEVLFSW